MPVDARDVATGFASARANVLPHHDIWFTKLTTSMAATTDRPTDRPRHTPRARARVAYALRASSLSFLLPSFPPRAPRFFPSLFVPLSCDRNIPRLANKPAKIISLLFRAIVIIAHMYVRTYVRTCVYTCVVVKSSTLRFRDTERRR